MSKRHSESTIKSDTATKQIKYSSQQTQAVSNNVVSDFNFDLIVRQQCCDCMLNVCRYRKRVHRSVYSLTLNKLLTIDTKTNNFWWN